jgi:hypothetical protein
MVALLKWSMMILPKLVDAACELRNAELLWFCSLKLHEQGEVAAA